MASDAQLKANKRYLDKLDRVVFYVNKGDRDLIKAYAEQHGMSLNGYINKLVEDDMNK